MFIQSTQISNRYKLRMQIEQYKKSTQTAHQTSELVEQCSILKRSLRGFEKLRSVYLPGLVQFLSDLDEDLSFDEDSQPENA